MSEEPRYTISELADLAGVTPRTIRYYTAEGLLPPPDARGRYALYGEEHLLRLQLIGRLKDAYLPLGEIKARLEQLTVEQVGQLLAEYNAPPEPEAEASAADYVAHLLTRQSKLTLPGGLAEARAPYSAAAESGPILRAQAPSSASELQAAEAEPARTSLPPPAAPPYGYATPAQPAPPAAVPASPQGGLLRKLIPQRRERAATPQQADTRSEPEESWRRVALAPGVELHVREPTAPTLKERIERLIALARELFDDER